MLTGFNTDFKYKGKVYHVQTEDNGVKNPVIVTLLYQGGAILASRKTSYADIIKFERLDKVVKELMETQHKQVIKDLVAGKFEAAKEPVEEVLEATTVVEEPAPFGSDVISDKSLDEVILDYLADDENK
jgi:septum formation inhibitor-activating ATPase MinD